MEKLKPEKKYRPYFTLPELRAILDSLLSHPIESQDKLRAYLNKYIFEISNEFRLPAVEVLNLPSKAQTLEQKNRDQERYMLGEMSPDEEREFERVNNLLF